jgi:hypothetical protein
VAVAAQFPRQELELRQQRIVPVAAYAGVGSFISARNDVIELHATLPACFVERPRRDADKGVAQIARQWAEVALTVVGGDAFQMRPRYQEKNCTARFKNTLAKSLFGSKITLLLDFLDNKSENFPGTFTVGACSSIDISMPWPERAERARIRRVGSLPRLPRIDIRALERDADGQHSGRRRRATGRRRRRLLSAERACHF